MSNSLAINDSSTKFANAQKMSFSQTCNLLSQYVKEKRALGGSAAEGFNRSTMNLFPVKHVDDSNGLSVGRTINLFPQISGFNSSLNKRATPEPQAATMTIFYGGQVVVFNDLPADKANEVMNLASSFESSLKKRKVENPASPPAPVVVSSPKPTINKSPILSSNPSQKTSPSHPQNMTVGAPNFGSNVIPAASAVPRTTARAASDLPIARKASLHRFLEKRKDRLVCKAPPSEDGVATKPVEGKAWLGLNSLTVFKKQQQQL